MARDRRGEQGRTQVLRTFRALLSCVLLVAATALFTAETAHADQKGAKCKTRDQYGRCLVWVTVPAKLTKPDRPQYQRGPATVCRSGGKTIPCTKDGGFWLIKYECYAKRVKNPPPKSHPAWEGHKRGALYTCTYPGDPVDTGVVIWLPTAPNLPPPDPELLAQSAVAAMDLQAIKIGIVPEDKPGRVGLVGLPTWMWVADRGPSTWGPITRSASERGYSVSATARVERVVWAMGDGEVVVCRKPGIPYAARFGERSSPECGYRYTEQGRYTVQAASYWLVTWRGMGQSGEIRFQLTSQTRIAVGELQLIRTR